jgi:heptaprenyl diphosphate synthase
MTKNKKMVLISLLVSQALILSFIESMLPIHFFMPGAKLGLANIITLASLYLFKFHESLFIVVLRTFLAASLFGTMISFLYSISGGLLSLLAMYFTIKVGRERISIIGTSVIGAVFHSIGQICVAILIIQNIKLVMYLPYLIVISVGTGIFVGITAKYLLHAFDKLGILKDVKN